MPKITNLFIVFLLVTLSSCKNDGKQIESSKAEQVQIIKSNTTITYNTIKTGSVLEWRASHLGGLDPRHGKIYCKEASILVNTNEVTNMSVLIDMSTLTVEDLPEESIKELTEHLKSDDFFNTEKYPNSKFELTHIKAIQDEYNSEITGNLIILGLSKSITFNANVTVLESEVSINSEAFVIDRSDWKMTYNAEGTTGVPLDYLISNDVGFSIDITILK